jgi:hypothetical protein
VKTSTLLNTDFEFTAGDPKSEAINNAVTCVNIKVEVRTFRVCYVVVYVGVSFVGVSQPCWRSVKILYYRVECAHSCECVVLSAPSKQ